MTRTRTALIGLAAKTTINEPEVAGSTRYFYSRENRDEIDKKAAFYPEEAKKLGLPVPNTPFFVKEAQAFWSRGNVKEIRLRVQDKKGNLHIIGNRPSFVKMELPDKITRYFLEPEDQGRTHFSLIAEGFNSPIIYEFWDLRKDLPLLTIKDLMEITGKSYKQIRYLIEKKVISALKFGKDNGGFYWAFLNEDVNKILGLEEIKRAEKLLRKRSATCHSLANSEIMGTKEVDLLSPRKKKKRGEK